MSIDRQLDTAISSPPIIYVGIIDTYKRELKAMTEHDYQRWELDQAVEHDPSDATAIISDDVPLTYLELNRRINSCSHFLTFLGVKKGIASSALLDNRKEYIEIFFALSKLGAIIVPLNWRLGGFGVTVHP